MSTDVGPAAPEIAPPPYQRIREVRLAVVMYGGVSLAIYMNGVAQELFHLVRSTAPSTVRRRETTGDPDDDDFTEPDERAIPSNELSGTERVYRKLGQLLGSDRHSAAELSDDDPILTRFVIDVLSGASAGGINAVYLAKALANDQSMSSLGKLWIEEGDISKLLNDRRSFAGLAGLRPSKAPPGSLLNGQRMYYKLLEAFDGMDADDRAGRSTPDRISRLADELDLYVTTTDLVGLRLPIRLRNTVITERRYRNVFHFAYSTAEATGDQRNDFHADRNPALAFVSRCTSAFPWAFEPMVLQDVDPVIARFGGVTHPYREQEHGSSAPYWNGVLPDYVSAEPGSVPLTARAFGDGGALDNKPFSYATEAVSRRRADIPVDRKLLFIEPDPGHPDRESESAERPDVIQNFLAQGVSLPRQETIREDLQRIAERNRFTQRVDRILLEMERERAPASNGAQRISGEAWAGEDAHAQINEFGPAYGGYHRLKVAAVTDDIVALVARVGGLEEGSDYEVPIRSIVRAWRRDRYRSTVETARDETVTPGLESENRFLVEFDLAFRLRRLNYLQRKLDELYPLDRQALEVLAAITEADYVPEEQDRTAFRDEVLYFKRAIASIYTDLRLTGRQLRSRSPDNPIRHLVEGTGITRGLLDEALELRTEALRERWGREQAERRAPAIDALAKEMSARIADACERASVRLQRALDLRDEAEEDARRIVAAFVRLAHDGFDGYDMVAFPMTYGTRAGETDVVEVIRVSPEDTSTSIANPTAAPKVTGARYMHFGAFLDKVWRQNDILRGRLDAADILIEALVPQPDDGADEVACAERAELVDRLRGEAQRAILAEELDAADRSKLIGLLAETMAKLDPADRNVERLRKMLEADGVATKGRLEAALRLAVEDEEALRRYYETEYQVDTSLEPKHALRTIGRGAHIAGQMLGGVAESRHLQPLGRVSAWAARAGQLVSGMTEAAIPGGFWHLVTAHFLILLYVFEGLAIAFGLLFNLGVVQRFGIVALVLTVVGHIALLVLGDWLVGGSAYRRMARVALAIVLIAVAILTFVGVRHLPDEVRDLVGIGGHAAMGRDEAG